jgi:hypothetical protein
MNLIAWLKAIKVTLADEDIIDVLIFNLNKSWRNIATSVRGLQDVPANT